MTTTTQDRRPPISLAELTTIALGGPAPSMTTTRSASEVAEAVGVADRGGGVLVLGGGSNLVVADRGVEVPVVRIGVRGVRVEPAGRYDAVPGQASFEAIATIGAGENWDDVVAELVADGWAGVETLSGIPGSAGATPVQNVGAYGGEIADTLIDVELYDRATGVLRRVPAAELRLGYRSSVLKATERGVVTSLRLGLARRPAPVRYRQLATALGCEVGDVVPVAAVREAALGLRRAKGMVLDAADADTRSVGSFFTNPVVDREALGAVLSAVARRCGPDVAVPQYPVAGGVKIPAAWVIERAGFTRGYPGGDAGIMISTKHTLALTNRGGGTTRELLALAREIRDGVSEAFGVTLRPEPVFVGTEWTA